MKTKKYTEKEKEFNKVLSYQQERLENIHMPDMTEVDVCIDESEALLQELGIEPTMVDVLSDSHTHIHIPTWEELSTAASGYDELGLESLFTNEELAANRNTIMQLNNEYNEIHRLDKIDYAIAVGAGMLGALIDILLVGLPEYHVSGGNEGKPLSEWIRKYFEDKYPDGVSKVLAKNAKVPYDAPNDNFHGAFLKEKVEGLNPNFHRLLSLGHDPLIGFVVGVADIMNGNMTTIDKTGKIVRQSMDGFLNYEKRKETDIVKAMMLQF